jgi:hypothetical protein
MSEGDNRSSNPGDVTITPPEPSLRLYPTVFDFEVSNVLIDRVRRREPGALAELVNRIRNKQGMDEELSAVCDLAEGNFDFDSHFKEKENAARKANEFANFIFQLMQAGHKRHLVKLALKEFPETSRRTVQYALAKYREVIKRWFKKPS